MRKNRHKSIAAVLLFCVVLSLYPVVGMLYGATEEVTDDSTYRYTREGKVDPFKPFIEIEEKEKGKSTGDVKPGTAAEEVQWRPPLERFGVEEFNLVGIIWNKKSQIATVEDSKGKFYTLQVGSKIGLKDGIVENILPDQVVVVEKMKDAFDNVTLERVILMLRTGEEGEL
ncbi:MAG: pilus assembly protein PilP [Deltaproteobacteria bacterium]|nr:pilus assembly protein PilP [Deltaproteobacteria bacterium]